MPRRVKFEGLVVRKPINIGSKSEHEAYVLVTADAEYKLRRRGGHAFDDPGWHDFLGKQVRAAGILSARQLIAEDVEIIDPDR